MTTTRIGRILTEVRALALPGVFDTLSARIAERAGFPMAFVSGYGVAATAIGEPDLGLLTQTEMVERARHICGRIQTRYLAGQPAAFRNGISDSFSNPTDLRYPAK